MPVKQSLVYGAFVLLVSAVINRILGFINQIVVVRLIGAEGIGLFNMVFPVYVMAIVIATAGIPVAIAKLVAEEMARGNRPGARKIFRLAFTLIIVLSGLVTVAVIILNPFITSKVITNPKAYWAFVTLIPGIFICAICSSFRGYFQGLSEMSPTAITQVIEQIVRVVTGLAVAFMLLPKGIEFAAIGVSVGVVCGELAGLLVMVAIYWSRRKKVSPALGAGNLSNLGILKRLFIFALPVTVNRVISTLILSVDVVLIPQRLQEAGYSLQEATSLYGQLSGMALTLLFIPTVLTVSLATTLVPAISDALAKGNLTMVQGRSGDAIWATLIFGLPSLVIFFLLPHQLTDLLFNYPEAGAPLRLLALGGAFLYIHQITTGILHGLGKPGLVLKNMVLASLAKIAGIYYLTAIPSLGINGTALALVINFVLAAALNVFSIARISGFTLNARKLVVKPSLAVAGMALAMIVTGRLLVPTATLPAQTFWPILTGSGTYFLLLAATGGITRQDLQRLPYLNRFLR